MSLNGNLISSKKSGLNFIYTVNFNSIDKATMGTMDMYTKFNIAYDDFYGVSKNFFLSETGTGFLMALMCDKKYKLISGVDTNTEEFREQLKKTMSIIGLFFKEISLNPSNLTLYNSFYNRKTDMVKKFENALYNDYVEIINSAINNLIEKDNQSSQITEVSSSSIITSFGMKNQILTMINSEPTNIFLSPVDSSVFPDLVNYLSTFIGEGEKMGTDLEKQKTKIHNGAIVAMKYLLGFNMQLTEHEKYKNGVKSQVSDEIHCPSKLNKNSDIHRLNFLKFIFDYPDFMLKFISIYQLLVSIDQVKYRINKFDDILSIFSDKHIVFTYEIVNNKLVNIKKYFDITRGEENESDTPFCTINENDIKQPTLSKIMEILSGINRTLIDMTNSDAIFKSVITGKFGTLQTNIGGSEGPDEWQLDFMGAIDSGLSVLLVGDTSGGKTAISLFQMRKIFYQMTIEGFSKVELTSILYIAPTDVLANQQYANMLRQFSENINYIGVCTETLVNIPEQCRLLIGTPREVRNYLFKSKISEKPEKTNIENLSNKFADAMSNTEIHHVKKLFIDEIQTMSSHYAQSNSIEQKMNCKAIEEILSTIQYSELSESSNSQVIGMSATLSRNSIDNLINKIKNITRIPHFETVSYSFNDIGFKRGMNRSTFVPIMKRQVRYPIKIENANISKFEIDQEIEEQELSERAIELVIRDAIRKGTIPFAAFTGTELETISMFQRFVNYLENKSNECTIWNELYREYTTFIENNTYGHFTKEKTSSRQTWLSAIKNKIDANKDKNSTDIVNRSDFLSILDKYNKAVRETNEIVNTVELYGLMYEYLQIFDGNYQKAFRNSAHPYYRFGSETGSDKLFALHNDDGSETLLFKLLKAQDADPTKNTANIIPIILKGIKYGVNILTQSIPYGYQVKIFEFLNIQTKNTGNRSPVPITFCDYGMAAGVNVSFLSGCIFFKRIQPINVSIFYQINGRFGRRGVSSSIQPVTYMFNVQNANNIGELEDLDFTNAQLSNFFSNDEVVEFLAKIMVIFESNRQVINLKNTLYTDLIISSDCFKNLKEADDTLKVREIHIAKYQIREIFDRCRHIVPELCNTLLRKMYFYLQAAEFTELNVHANLH